MYVSYREGVKGKRMAMRNARLKVQNFLLRLKAEVYIPIRLHNIPIWRPIQGRQSKAILINDVVQASHKLI